MHQDKEATKPAAKRYKRCPKCRAMLRPTAEICPHCGVSMPVSFPYNPLVSGETFRVLQELSEEVEPPRHSRAPIAARYLVLVARDREDLFNYLRRQFAKEVGVEVRYERRVGERRGRAAVAPLDRRRKDRRGKPSVDADLRRFGFAIVRLE